MAISTAEQASIIKLAVGMFNAAPGGYMGTLQDAFSAGGSSLVNLANTLANTPVFTGLNSSYTTNAPDAAFATAWVNNMVGDTATVANKDAAVNFVIALLGGGQSRGAVMNQVITLLDGIAYTDPNWGNASLLFDNRVSVATTYTITQGGTSTSIPTLQDVLHGTVWAAWEYFPTTAADTLLGTSGNDTFYLADPIVHLVGVTEMTAMSQTASDANAIFAL